MQGWYLNSGHDVILPNHFSLIFLCYMVWAVKSIVRKPRMIEYVTFPTALFEMKCCSTNVNPFSSEQCYFQERPQIEHGVLMFHRLDCVHCFSRNKLQATSTHLQTVVAVCSTCFYVKIPCILPTQRFYEFRMITTINSDYFQKQV
jgi:hypothetical protein